MLATEIVSKQEVGQTKLSCGEVQPRRGSAVLQTAPGVAGETEAQSLQDPREGAGLGSWTPVSDCMTG